VSPGQVGWVVQGPRQGGGTQASRYRQGDTATHRSLPQLLVLGRLLGLLGLLFTLGHLSGLVAGVWCGWCSWRSGGAGGGKHGV